MGCLSERNDGNQIGGYVFELAIIVGYSWHILYLFRVTNHYVPYLSLLTIINNDESIIEHHHN